MQARGISCDDADPYQQFDASMEAIMEEADMQLRGGSSPCTLRLDRSKELHVVAPPYNYNKNLAHASLACWHHIKRIRGKCQRCDLLLELIPLGQYGGTDFVDEICKNEELQLWDAEPDDNINLGAAMKKLETIIFNFSNNIWHSTFD